MRYLGANGCVIALQDQADGEHVENRDWDAAPPVLCFRLTGRTRVEIQADQPLRAGATRIEFDAPTVHRGGHEGIRATVTALGRVRALSVLPRSYLESLPDSPAKAALLELKTGETWPW